MCKKIRDSRDRIDVVLDLSDTENLQADAIEIRAWPLSEEEEAGAEPNTEFVKTLYLDPGGQLKAYDVWR